MGSGYSWQEVVQYGRESWSVRSCLRLEALTRLSNGAIPIPRLVNGHTVYDDPSDIAAGGLIRHTSASSTGIPKLCIFHLFREGGVLFEMSRDASPDLGLFYLAWSLDIGWPANLEATISVVVSG